LINTREIASEILQRIYKKQHLDKICDNEPNFNKLDQRDKNFVRLTILETLRRNIQIDSIIKRFLTKPLEYKRIKIENLLRISICQILFLKVSEYAVVNTSVEIAKKYKFHKLVNAILRNVCRQKKQLLNEFGNLSNLPGWILKDLKKNLASTEIKQVSKVIVEEPELNLKIKKSFIKFKNWEAIMDGKFIESDILLTKNNGKINKLPFFDKGLWWVQGLSSCLPVKCLDYLFPISKRKEKKILEVCAAPGGKTAQLADYGFQAISLDISEYRISQLKTNLDRLNYKPKIICIDFLNYNSDQKFDAILLDAPCSASGLIQKKPEILITNKHSDLKKLTFEQNRLLEYSKEFVKKGGYIIYCVCSINNCEGYEQINKFLKTNKNFSSVNHVDGIKKYGKILSDNMLQIYPKQFKFTDNINGYLDGFFISILKKEKNN
jgi:16S rRNA (cytosine967-C5)-methyltransferase